MVGMKRIHILRPGTFSSVSAGEVTLSKADLIDLAAAFDGGKSNAPIVVGHPKLNSPAFGWIKALEADASGNVFAVPRDVNPQFAELVKAETYKTVSASLLPPTHKGNPTPGKWSLRHVGFLGGHAPAIAGLEGVEFGAEDGEVLTVELGAWDEASGLWSASRMFRRLREWLVADKGIEAADAVLPDYDVRSVEDAARSANEAAANAATHFAAPAGAPATQESTVSDQTVDLAARESALASREAALEAGEAKIAAAAKSAHRASIVSFAEGLVAKGILLPAELPVVVDLAAELDADTAVEFGEGDGKTTATRLKAFQTLLEAMPKRVPVGEIVRGESEVASADFAAPRGAEVSSERMAIHAKALAHQAKNPGLDYRSAALAVEAGG